MTRRRMGLALFFCLSCATVAVAQCVPTPQAAAAFRMTKKNFRKLQGYRDLWMLKAVLHPSAEEKQATSMQQVAFR